MKVFHDPKHKVINFLDERFYTEDNITFYPSVTTILEAYPKGYGFNEYLKKLGFNADAELEKAGNEGSKIHDAIDRWLKGERVSWVDEKGNANYILKEWIMIKKAVEFFIVHKPEILAQEISILDKDLKIGGTIDLVCKINNEIWLIDYKSSNYIWKTHELQLSAYIALWNRSFPEHKINKHGILHLKAMTRGANGDKIQGKGWQLKEFERPWRDAYRVFDHTKNIWNEENPNYIPKNEEYPDFFEMPKGTFKDSRIDQEIKIAQKTPEQRKAKKPVKSDKPLPVAPQENKT